MRQCLRYRDDGASVDCRTHPLSQWCSSTAPGIGTGFSTRVTLRPSRSSPPRCVASGQALSSMTSCAVSRAASAPRTQRGWGSHQVAVVAWHGPRVSLVIEITELPVGTWTSDYKEWLDEQVGKDAGSWTSSRTAPTPTCASRSSTPSGRRRCRAAGHIKGTLATCPSGTCASPTCGTFWRRRQRQSAGVDEIFTDHAAVRTACTYPQGATSWSS
jgi:hypothetical protein